MVTIDLENSGLLKLAAIVILATRVSPSHSHKDIDHSLHRTIITFSPLQFFSMISESGV